MQRVLYELLGAEGLRFSPYCWRTRLALAHKGLAFETQPCKFTEKERIAFSGQDRVPILVDGETIVSDSWGIASYLEDGYPELPSLFGNDPGRALSRFVNRWTDTQLNPFILRIIIEDLYEHVHPDDRAYFLTSRRQRLGQAFDAVAAQRETYLDKLKGAFKPMELALHEQPFLAGDAPAYADFIVAGTLQWARLVSKLRLVAPDSTVDRWWRQMLERFGTVLIEGPFQES